MALGKGFVIANGKVPIRWLRKVYIKCCFYRPKVTLYLKCGLWNPYFRVGVQGVESLGGHFATLCWEFDFYEVKKKYYFFQKEQGNTFTLFIIIIVKSLQKEQNSTNLRLWPPICRNKCAITPKWINSLETNFIHTYIPYIWTEDYRMIISKL
jgi:hypothetical protein